MAFCTVIIMGMLALCTAAPAENFEEFVLREQVKRQTTDFQNYGNPEIKTYPNYKTNILKIDTCAYGVTFYPLNFANCQDFSVMGTTDMKDTLDGSPSTANIAFTVNDDLVIGNFSESMLSLLCIETVGIYNATVTCDPTERYASAETRVITMYQTNNQFWAGCTDFYQFKTDKCHLDFHKSAPTSSVKGIYGENCKVQATANPTASTYLNNIQTFTCSSGSTVQKLDATFANMFNGVTGKNMCLYNNSPTFPLMSININDKTTITWNPAVTCKLHKICGYFYRPSRVIVKAIGTSSTKTRGMGMLLSNQYLLYGCTDFLGFPTKSIELEFEVSSTNTVYGEKIFGQCCV